MGLFQKDFASNMFAGTYLQTRGIQTIWLVLDSGPVCLLHSVWFNRKTIPEGQGKKVSISSMYVDLFEGVDQILYMDGLNRIQFTSGTGTSSKFVFEYSTEITQLDLEYPTIDRLLLIVRALILSRLTVT